MRKEGKRKREGKREKEGERERGGENKAKRKEGRHPKKEEIKKVVVKTLT